MALDEWKKAYQDLDPSTRRAFARWVLEQEMGNPGVLPSGDPPSLRPRTPAALPLKPLLLVAGLGLLALGGWKGWEWKQRTDEARARRTVAEREAEEARKPHSPLNLDALSRQLGKEVTVTGIPEASEIGALYFSRDRRKSLRINFFHNGVVLLQSRELEDWVRNRTELTLTGVVSQGGDGRLEMRISSLAQIRTRPVPSP